MAVMPVPKLGTAVAGAVLLKRIYQKKVSNLDNHILPEPVQA